MVRIGVKGELILGMFNQTEVNGKSKHSMLNLTEGLWEC